MSRPVRAAVLPGPRRPIELREYPEPALAEGEALLETIFSEVCGTDAHLWNGRLDAVPYPIIPGHVSVGRLAAIRGTISDLDGAPFREGDVVAFLDVHGTCGACRACLVDRQTTRCPHRRVYGITYGAADGLLGGWAERIHLKAGVKVLRLPESVPPELYIGGGCGLVTAVHAVERAGVRPGDAVVVLGTGPVGQSAVALAAIAGADAIVAIGAPDDRLRMAERMGADGVLSIETLPHAARRERVRALLGGRGADVVLEATGAPQAVVEAADLARDGGTVVVAGQYTDNGEATWNVHALLNRKHLDVRGCWGSDYAHFHKAIRILARHGGRVPWRDLVTRRYALEEAGEALRAVETRALLKAAIVPNGGPL